MKQITKEWLTAANDDLLIIQEVRDKDYLTHLVAFHAQQAIEKSLKGLLEEFFEEAPKLHHLTRLCALVESYIQLESEKENRLIEELDKLYIDARYPGELGLLPNGKPSLNEAHEFYDFALYFHKKIKAIIERNS